MINKEDLKNTREYGYKKYLSTQFNDFQTGSFMPNEL